MEPLQPKKRVPFPPESKPNKQLMPLRCPQPDHDKATGIPLKFGIDDAKDRELEKKLLLNMRLADIDKMANEASDIKLPSKKENQKINRSSSSSSVSPEGDMSLVTAMAGRLRNAEQTIAALKEEVKKKDAELKELRATQPAAGPKTDSRKAKADEATAVGKVTEADAAMLKEHNQKLRDLLRRADLENKQLMQENGEMKKFLSDYGMKWVGDEVPKPKEVAPMNKPPLGKGKDLLLGAGEWNPSVAAGEQGAEKSGSDSAPLNDNSGPEALGTPFEPGRIMANVRELNLLAGEGQKEVELGKDGIRRLKEKNLVRYIFYKNGIFPRGGPLRPYKLKESKILVKDLMDGYFPWELKDEYPEGVPLRVEMRLDEMHGGGSAEPSFVPFGGNGMALGKNDEEAAAQYKASRSNGSEIWQPAAGRSKGDTLFRKLPESVVRNGNIIPIKDEIMGIVQGKASAAEQESSQVQHIPLGTLHAPAQSKDNDVEPSDGRKALLKVKLPDGNKVLECKLSYSATIGDLKKFLRDKIAYTGQFKVKTSFPNMEYNDTSQTLEAAGLVPNAMLMMIATN